MTIYLLRSVNIPLPNFGRVIAEPVLNRAPVAREHPSNVANRHSVFLAQANRFEPHLPDGFIFVGIFVVHFLFRNLGRGAFLAPRPDHIRQTKDLGVVGGKAPSPWPVGLRFLPD